MDNQAVAVDKTVNTVRYTHGSRLLSRLVKQNKLDLRTRAAKSIKATEEALVDQVGGIEHVTPARRIVIRHAAVKHYRLTLMDQASLSGTAEWCAKDYVQLSNSLTRDLQAIGLDAAAREPERLADYLRRKTGQTAEEARSDAIEATVDVLVTDADSATGDGSGDAGE